MKSKEYKRSTGVRFADILQSFTDQQLKWIGAVAMAFNDAETVMHRVFGACIHFPGNAAYVSTRIGIGTLPTLVKLALPRFGLDDKTITNTCWRRLHPAEGVARWRNSRSFVGHVLWMGGGTRQRRHRLRATC